MSSSLLVTMIMAIGARRYLLELALYDIDGKHLFRFTYQTGFRGAVVQFAGGFVQDGFLAEENFGLSSKWRRTWMAWTFNCSPCHRKLFRTMNSLYLHRRANPCKCDPLYNIVEDILAAGGACLNGCSNAWGHRLGRMWLVLGRELVVPEPRGPIEAVGFGA